MARWFDPYQTWLGIPPAEQSPNYYRLLGLETFESDLDAIEAAVGRRAALLRTHQAGRYAEYAQDLLAEVNAARLCLLAPDRKAAYDAQLRDAFARAEENRLARARRGRWLLAGGLLALAAALLVAIAIHSGRRSPQMADRAPEAVARVKAPADESPRPKLSAELEEKPRAPAVKPKTENEKPKADGGKKSDQTPATAQSTPGLTPGARQVKPKARPAPPVLLKPAQGGVVPNGSRDRGRAPAWEFQWAPVDGATAYHIQVERPRGKRLQADVSDLTAPQFHLTPKNAIPNPALRNWHWRVRALVDGRWTDWTEHTFDVAPAEPEPQAKEAPRTPDKK